MKTTLAQRNRPSVIVFPDGAWNRSPFAALLQSIAAKHTTGWVTNRPDRTLEGAPAGVQALSPADCDQVDWSRTTAVALHPYWTPFLLPRRPRLLGFCASGSGQTAGSDEHLNKWRDRLGGEASFVLTPSESYYLDLSFRRDGVFVVDGADETSDWFALQALMWAADGTDPLPLARLQQQRREAAYRERMASSGGSAALSFYRSVYLYLLGDAAQAQKELLNAFELSVLGGDEQALARVYRFRSAIQTALGLTAEAAMTYETTAITEQERANAEQLRRRLEAGQADIAAAMLLRWNDDHRGATARLERMLQTEPIEEGGAADQESTAVIQEMLIDSLLQAGRIRQANAKLAEWPSFKIRDRCEYELLRGTACLYEGRRLQAVRAFLRAAELRQEAIGALSELAHIDAATKRLAEGESSHA